MSFSLPIKRGCFITLEGVDGAGKSSHLDAIVDWVGTHVAGAPACTLSREPGGTPLGEQLRAILLHQAMSPMSELLTVFAARAEHVAQRIAPALARGDWVVCDRFTDSTLAYQGGGRGLSTPAILQLAQLVHGDCQPDLTLIFDVSPDVASARVAGRGAADKFESETASFTAAVRAAYLGIAAREPQRCVLINGALPIAQVRTQVIDALNRHFEARLESRLDSHVDSRVQSHLESRLFNPESPA